MIIHRVNHNNKGVDVVDVSVRENIDGVRYTSHIIPMKEYNIAKEIAKDTSGRLLDTFTHPHTISGDKVNINNYDSDIRAWKNSTLTMSHDDAAYMRKYFLKVIRKKVNRIRKKEKIEAYIYNMYKNFIKLIKGDKHKESMKSVSALYDEIIEKRK